MREYTMYHSNEHPTMTNYDPIYCFAMTQCSLLSQKMAEIGSLMPDHDQK